MPWLLTWKVSEVAKVAEKVGNGAITRDMLSSEVLAQLDANGSSASIGPITRDMLPQDVRDDLNKTVTITRSMLPADVLSDLNRTISKSMLGSDVLADLNKSSTTASPITLSMLAPEVITKLDQNSATEANTSTLVAFRVRKENNQTGLTNGNYSKVTWESSSIDHTNNFDLAQDAFIVPEDGLYAISSSARFSLVETGNFANLIIKRNNESINSGITIRAGGDSGVYISSVSAIVDANKSDILTIVGGQNGSTSPVTIINSSATYFEGFKIAGSYSNSIQPKSITKSMLGNDILSELNATIGMNRLSSEIRSKLDQNTTVADGSVTASKLANNTITTSQLNEQILKYLKPEITIQPQTLTIYADTNGSLSVTAEGKYLGYQWKKDGGNLTSETNSTLNITDANATQHDGNYSVVVSNDFGSVESGVLELKVIDAIMNGLVAWWKFDETNGTVAYDSSGNGNDGNLSGGLTWTTGKIGGALSFDGVNDLVRVNGNWPSSNSPRAISVWFFTNNTHRGNIFTFGDGARINTRFSVLTNYGENGNLHFCGQGNDVGLGSMTFNQWRHLCVTYSSNLINAFVDNQLFASVSKNLNTDGSMPLIVGSNSLTRDDEFFSGKLDDLRVYDRALSAAEVQALYNMGQ